MEIGTLDVLKVGGEEVRNLLPLLNSYVHQMLACRSGLPDFDELVQECESGDKQVWFVGDRGEMCCLGGLLTQVVTIEDGRTVLKVLASMSPPDPKVRGAILKQLVAYSQQDGISAIVLADVEGQPEAEQAIIHVPAPGQFQVDFGAAGSLVHEFEGSC